MQIFKKILFIIIILSGSLTLAAGAPTVPSVDKQINRWHAIYGRYSHVGDCDFSKQRIPEFQDMMEVASTYAINQGGVDAKDMGNLLEKFNSDSLTMNQFVTFSLEVASLKDKAYEKDPEVLEVKEKKL